MRTFGHLEIKKRCAAAIPSLMKKFGLEYDQCVQDEQGWVNPCFYVGAYVVRFNARDPGLPKFQREKLVYELLQESAVPVPKEVWLDDSRELTEFDVLISRRLPGRNLEQDWGRLNANSRGSLVADARRLLAELHTIEFNFFGELGGRGPLPKCSSWRDYILSRMEYLITEARDIATAEEFECLRSQAATYNLNTVRTSKLVHVDYHFGNLLYQGQRITGVVDFEWSFAGDPLYDYVNWWSSDEVLPGSHKGFMPEFTKEEIKRLTFYRALNSLELSTVAKLHFPPDEARAYRECALLHMRAL